MLANPALKFVGVRTRRICANSLHAIVSALPYRRDPVVHVDAQLLTASMTRVTWESDMCG